MSSNVNELRIRKLTPKECWRLMGFDDSDFEKAEKVNSNTQLYKQAGNSIVVPVLEHIIGALFDCGALENKREEEKPMENVIEKDLKIVPDALAEKSVVEVDKSEYEALVRKAETLRIIAILVNKDSFVPTDTIRTIVNGVCISNKTEREELQNELI